MRLIQKFGGTSVATPARMMDVMSIVTRNRPRVLVLSAVAGTTNALYGISQQLKLANISGAIEQTGQLKNFYKEYIAALYLDKKYRQMVENKLTEIFERLMLYTEKNYSAEDEKSLVAFGEYISTYLFSFLLKSYGFDSVLLNAADILKKDIEGNPDMRFIEARFAEIARRYDDNQILVIQGFICNDHNGIIDNFERGGSDFTATLIGEAVNADLIEIWTDINGLHNNDPRYVENTSTVNELSYKEASELAFFGAKILHPKCIDPAKNKNIPIHLKNTFQPNHPGTMISSRANTDAIKAIAAKDGLTAIRIESARMFMTYGFLSKVFDIFEKYKTAIDMITTAEVSVSLTIENTTNLHEIQNELISLGAIEIASHQTIVCVVGDFMAEKPGLAGKVLKNIESIPIRMISYGGSKNNISILINTNDKVKTLQLLQNGIFNCNESIEFEKLAQN